MVTPEAVELDLPSAGVGTRSVAKLIDLVGQLVLLFVGLGATGMLGGASFTLIVGIIWVFVVLFVVPIACEALWFGRTPGKAALGLRAVTLDGGPLQTRHAIVRGLFQLIDIYLVLGIFPAMFTQRSQRFGDVAAGTFVLNDRVSSPPTDAIIFPPPLGHELYSESLDVGRITRPQYLLMRKFLLRVNELDGGARFHLAQRLATESSQRVGAYVPPGLHPETFVLCVVAAYQQRTIGFDTGAAASRWGWSSPAR
jgi:uncharacterized RDD family membrane protein YckC